MTDLVNPDHYKNKGGRQIIELARLLPFSLGNAVKYIYRGWEGKKEDPMMDLQKASWYLNDAWLHSAAVACVVPARAIVICDELSEEAETIDENITMMIIQSIVHAACSWQGNKKLAETIVMSAIKRVDGRVKALAEEKGIV